MDKEHQNLLKTHQMNILSFYNIKQEEKNIIWRNNKLRRQKIKKKWVTSKGNQTHSNQN